MAELGCIADDLTGATDIAENLARTGRRVRFSVGVPAETLDGSDSDALVIALKTRTTGSTDAVSQSLGALRALVCAGVDQVFFKYCSTFDSTALGNIGPVSDALAKELGVNLCVFAPSYPGNQRTVFRAHLFVGDRLLSESGMATHPLTPMTDPNLVRVLSRQTAEPVSAVFLETVEAGPGAVSDALAALEAGGFRRILVDAVTEEHLRTIAQATAGHRLITGGAALAAHLPWNPAGLHRSGRFHPAQAPGRLVVCGSASQATRHQIAHARGTFQVHAVDVARAMADPAGEVSRLTQLAQIVLSGGSSLIHSQADPELLERVQLEHGVATAGRAIERVLAEVVTTLVERGQHAVIVGGGETSGAVVQRLGLADLDVGPSAAPEFPGCRPQETGRRSTFYSSPATSAPRTSSTQHGGSPSDR